MPPPRDGAQQQFKVEGLNPLPRRTISAHTTNGVQYAVTV